MKQKNCISQLNTDQLEAHLRSAVDALAPDIFDRLDLSVPQERPDSFESSARIVALQRRFRHALAGAAACVFISLAGGGAWHYQYQNIQVDSVIGLDVNPSLELSINRKQRVLKASPLNTEAEDILEDMDLKGVELNVAVNAVVGAMVTHGYFHELDNAVLVTVSNDSVRRAAALRASVVEDIERTLDENQVQAVVYDQQVIEKDEMKTLAEEYGISYGKAYFLKELIDQNDALTMDDMKELSSMTMEQIAERIADSSLELGEYAQKAPDPAQAAEPETEPQTEPETSAAEPETAETETETGTDASPDGTKEPQTVAGREQETESASVEEQESDLEELIRIDYVDYEDGLIYVYFADRISWKNPTVLVRDEDGNRYAAMVDDTSADECVIAAEGLDGGKTYVFVLGGIVPEDGSVTAAVTGYFDTPEIDGSLTGDSDDEDDEEAGSPEHGGTGESAGTGENSGSGESAGTGENSGTGESAGTGGNAGGGEGSGAGGNSGSGAGSGSSGSSGNSGSSGAGGDAGRGESSGTGANTGTGGNAGSGAGAGSTGGSGETVPGAAPGMWNQEAAPELKKF